MSEQDMSLRDKLREMCDSLDVMIRLALCDVSIYKSKGFKDIEFLAKDYGFKVFDMFVDCNGVDCIIFTHKGRTFLFKKEDIFWRSYPSF